MMLHSKDVYKRQVQFSLPVDIFKAYGVTSFRTKVMILQKKSRYVTERPVSYTHLVGYIFTNGKFVVSISFWQKPKAVF